jgi:hypothetical protein
MDAVYQAIVYGFLDLFFGSTVWIEYFGKNVIVHTDCFRNGFRTETAT